MPFQKFVYTQIMKCARHLFKKQDKCIFGYVDRSTVAHWYAGCFIPGRPGFKSRQGREFFQKISMNNFEFDFRHCNIVILVTPKIVEFGGTFDTELKA